MTVMLLQRLCRILCVTRDRCLHTGFPLKVWPVAISMFSIRINIITNHIIYTYLALSLSICVYIYISIHIYIFTSLYIYISISLSLYIYIYMYIYIYIYVCMCIYIYIYIYIYTHICIYTHIYNLVCIAPKGSSQSLCARSVFEPMGLIPTTTSHSSV